MEDKQKTYVCECGKTFNNPQAFNGHKSNCREHLGEEKYLAAKKRREEASLKAKEAIHKKSIEFHKSKDEELIKWQSEGHRCEKCGKVMTEKFGSGRFCSTECAHIKEYSEETRLKMSKSLMNFYSNNIKTFTPRLDFSKYIDGTKDLYLKKKIKPDKLQYYLLDKVENIDFVLCPYCGIRLSHVNSSHLKQHNKTVDDLKNEFGSDCLTISQTAHFAKSQASALAQEKLIEEGKHSGWKTRNIRSYAELFWEKVFNNNNIAYQPEYTVNKKDLGIDELGCYFLDFLIDGFIDVEIDGKQHTYEDRKEHDEKRDERITAYGFLIYRIPWINPSESEKVKQQIDDFLMWYDSVKHIKTQEKICG